MRKIAWKGDGLGKVRERRDGLGKVREMGEEELELRKNVRERGRRVEEKWGREKGWGKVRERERWTSRKSERGDLEKWQVSEVELKKKKKKKKQAWSTEVERQKSESERGRGSVKKKLDKKSGEL